MLAAGDALLAEREPALIGLADVLNPEWVVRRLSFHLGLYADHLNLRQTYIRYKPATSCLIGYAGQFEGQDVRLYTRMHLPSALDKARKPLRKSTSASVLGPPGFFDDEWGVLFMIYPNDHELRALPYVQHFAEHTQQLGHWLPSLQGKTISAINCLRYKPERRYAGRIKFADGPSLLLKAHARGFQRPPRPAALINGGEASFRIPERLDDSVDQRLITYPWIPGDSLDKLLLAQPQLVTEAGVRLASFHSLSACHQPRDQEQIWSDAVIDALVQSVMTIAPQLKPDLRVIKNHLSGDTTWRTRSNPLPYCIIHGDFSADQIIVGREDLWLIDFDRSRYDHPLHDLGSFIARLEFNALIEPTIGQLTAVELADRLIHGYEQVAQLAIQPLIKTFTIIHLLALVPEPFRLRRTHWLMETHALILRIRMLLEGTGADLDQ